MQQLSVRAPNSSIRGRAARIRIHSESGALRGGSPLSKATVSIVVPAYNEESHLRECLEAIGRQTVAPFEVIVVDNNSTDATAAIAGSFPFVTVINESRQGVMYARDCGFDTARGAIIGRLDADSVIAPNWVETIQKLFAADSGLSGATGTVQYREVCFPGVFNVVDFKIRSFMARRGARFGEQSVQGVNLAVRKTAWEAVKPYLCHERQHHEDLDLSMHMAHLNQKVIFAPEMVVSQSGRRADSPPRTFFNYAMSTPRTYRVHAFKTTRYAYPLTWLVIALYIPIRAAYRAYNPATGRFSVRCLISPDVTTGRVSPVAIAPTIPE